MNPATIYVGNPLKIMMDKNRCSLAELIYLVALKSMLLSLIAKSQYQLTP